MGQGEAEGRGFSPAEFADPTLSSFHAPHSLRPQAVRGMEYSNN